MNSALTLMLSNLTGTTTSPNNQYNKYICATTARRYLSFKASKETENNMFELVEHYTCLDGEMDCPLIWEKCLEGVERYVTYVGRSKIFGIRLNSFMDPFPQFLNLESIPKFFK